MDKSLEWLNHKTTSTSPQNLESVIVCIMIIFIIFHGINKDDHTGVE